MPPHSKFCLNRTIWSRVRAKKMIFFQYGVRPPSWICEFLNFSHISVDWVKICARIPNFVIFGRFAAVIWRYNDFQNGGRPPCWIYCYVIILYRKTEFNALDIVLNFDIYRFHTFWYTSTIMFHHLAWNCLFLPQFSRIFWKTYGKILNLNVVTPKGTSARETTCLELQLLNIFVYLWSVHETKEIVCLIDCVLVRKKLKFPYLSSQNGLTDFCQILHDNSTPQHNDIS